MQTIAKFVEDQDTLVLLQQLGVTYAQGYHIGKPASQLLSSEIVDLPDSNLLAS